MSDLDQLAADLAQAAVTVEREAPVVVGFAAGKVEQSARNRAPVRTAKLRGSIHTVRSLAGLSAEVVADSDHAVFVEYGTSRMAPEPFMAPAADDAETDFVAAMTALGGDVL